MKADFAELPRSSNGQPLVTAGIPIYNHARFVRAAIQSVIDQHYANIELIIINDGSKDESHQVVEAMRAVCERRFARFEYINRENRGLPKTLNEMLGWARGSYVAFLASDDVWLPDKTSRQVQYLDSHPETVGVYANAQIIDGDGNVFDDRVHPYSRFGFADILEHRHYLLAPSQLLRTDELRAAGGYDPSYTFEDWEVQLKMTEGTSRTFDVLPDVLCAYRRHPTNMSRMVDVMHRDRLRLVRLYRDHERFRTSEAKVYLIAMEGLALNGRQGAALRLLPRALGARKDRYFWRVLAKSVLPLSIVSALRRNKQY